MNLTEMLARLDTDQIPIEGVSFTHPQFENTLYPNQGTTWRFINQPDDTRLTQPWGGRYWYIAMPFQVSIPERAGELSQDMNVQLSLIDTTILNEINRASANAQESILFTYRLWANKNVAPAFELRLRISELTATGTSLSATATRADLLNRDFPSKTYNTDAFPGLDR